MALIGKLFRLDEIKRLFGRIGASTKKNEGGKMKGKEWGDKNLAKLFLLASLSGLKTDILPTTVSGANGRKESLTAELQERAGLKWIDGIAKQPLYL